MANFVKGWLHETGFNVVGNGGEPDEARSRFRGCSPDLARVGKAQDGKTWETRLNEALDSIDPETVTKLTLIHTRAKA
jgi:hypothetical protein